ncbi:MAG: alpha/beta fold hydrolase [Massilia sp.]
MNTHNNSVADGVRQASFELTIADESVGAAIWMPKQIHRPLPLLLVAHGGGQHKLFAPLAGHASLLARQLQCAVVAIDAPGHGGRSQSADMRELTEILQRQVRAGDGPSEAVLDHMLQNAAQAADEWRLVLDHLHARDDVDEHGAVGFIGMSMGAMTGILLAAREPRVSAAIFGLAGARDPARRLEVAAREIRIPLQFVLQWDDEWVRREDGLSLFDAFASTEKTLHANPGGHATLPPHERAGWSAFFGRHLMT